MCTETLQSKLGIHNMFEVDDLLKNLMSLYFIKKTLKASFCYCCYSTTINWGHTNSNSNKREKT